jgi:hypothetical protein
MDANESINNLPPSAGQRAQLKALGYSIPPFGRQAFNHSINQSFIIRAFVAFLTGQRGIMYISNLRFKNRSPREAFLEGQ